MAYEVRILPRAEVDVQRIYDWIKQRSPSGANSWWLAFEKARAELGLHPLSYSLAPEAEGSSREVRQILFKTRRGHYYRALYVVVSSSVRVLRVRGPGQPELFDDEIVTTDE